MSGQNHLSIACVCSGVTDGRSVSIPQLWLGIPWPRFTGTGNREGVHERSCDRSDQTERPKNINKEWTFICTQPLGGRDIPSVPLGLPPHSAKRIASCYHPILPSALCSMRPASTRHTCCIRLLGILEAFRQRHSEARAEESQDPSSRPARDSG